MKDQGERLTQFAYDVSGQLTNVTKPQVPDPVNGNNPAWPIWSYEYDQYGRLRVTTDPKNNSTTNTYNQFGQPVARLLPMGGWGETNFYNAKGQLTNHYDFKGQRTEFRHDQFGRVTNKFYFVASDMAHPSNSVRYVYNQLGQLTNITERTGNDAGTGYAALGNGTGKFMAGEGRHSLRAAVLATLGKMPTGGWGGMAALALCCVALSCIPREKRRRLVWCVVETWRYYNSVELVSKRRLRLPSWGWRIVTVITLICLLGSDPHFASLWTAQAACGDVPSTNLSTDTTRITAFTYDVDGRLAQVSSPEGYINYEYSLVTGRLTSTCTTNSEVAYGYDDLGRLESVTALKRNGDPVDETTTYTYTAVGSRETVTLPNNVVATYQYDSLNRLTNLTHVGDGSTLLSRFSYQLHPTGRRTNATEILQQEGGSYQTNTLTWQYDGMYRLTNEACMSSVSGASYTNAYQYDKAGNRWKKINVAGSLTTATTNQFNANDQLVKEVTSTNGVFCATNTYAYDANGSLTARTNVAANGSTNLYGYDLKNKLTSVAVFKGSWVTNNFRYNDQGIRVRTDVVGGSTKYFLVDANNYTGYAQVLEELNTLGGTPSRSYVIGDDVLAQCGNTSWDPRWLLYDGHGSTRQLVDANWEATSRYNYDAYGLTLATSTSSPETSLLYCGEQYDTALGMYNLRARFYDPSNGRFNAMDSFRGNNGDPQSLHKYAYGHSDPVNMIDPSGQFTLQELLVTTGIVAVLSVAAYPMWRTFTKATWRVGRANTGRAIAADIAIAQTEEVERPKSRAEVKARIKEKTGDDEGYRVFLHGTSSGAFPGYASGAVDFTQGSGEFGQGFYTTALPDGLLAAGAYAYQKEGNDGGFALLLIFAIRHVDMITLRSMPGRKSPPAARFPGFDFVEGPLISPFGPSYQYKWEFGSRGSALLLAGFKGFVPLPRISQNWANPDN